MNILKTISHLQCGADRVSKLRIRRAIIRRKLDYGSLKSIRHLKLLISNGLTIIHNLAIKLCTCAFRSSPVRSPCDECGEAQLIHRRTQVSLQHTVSMKRLQNTPAYEVVFNPRVIEPHLNENISAPLSVRMERFADALNLPEIYVHEYSLPQEIP